MQITQAKENETLGSKKAASWNNKLKKVKTLEERVVVL